MQKEKAVLLDSRTVAEDGKRVWVQIARVGQWAGHPSGPFQLTPSHFEEMVRAFKSTENRRIPYDFEHASEMDPRQGSVPTEGAPAQGWALDLDNRGEAGLWALTEWLEPAKSYIRGGKYRWVSPTIRFNARDPKTGNRQGCRLSSIALTNQPFLDGMAPLAAKDTNTGDTMPAVEFNVSRRISDYAERLEAEGHSQAKALELAKVRTGRDILAATNVDPSETFQLAERVRDREPGVTIVQLVDRLVKERPGLDRERAFIDAERMIRGR